MKIKKKWKRRIGWAILIAIFLSILAFFIALIGFWEVVGMVALTIALAALVMFASNLINS